MDINGLLYIVGIELVDFIDIWMEINPKYILGRSVEIMKIDQRMDWGLPYAQTSTDWTMLALAKSMMVFSDDVSNIVMFKHLNT